MRPKASPTRGEKSANPWSSGPFHMTSPRGGGVTEAEGVAQLWRGTRIARGRRCTTGARATGSRQTGSSFQPQLLSAPAHHLGCENRAILAHGDFVGIEMWAPARVGAPQDANDFAIGIDFQNTPCDCVGH